MTTLFIIGQILVYVCGIGSITMAVLSLKNLKDDARLAKKKWVIVLIVLMSLMIAINLIDLLSKIF